MLPHFQVSFPLWQGIAGIVVLCLVSFESGRRRWLARAREAIEARDIWEWQFRTALRNGDIARMERDAAVADLALFRGPRDRDPHTGRFVGSAR